MDTVERKDYSLHLRQLPETDFHPAVMKRAQHIIHLLSLNADSVVEGTYTLHHKEITLPKKYHFGNVPVCYLPGWGSYVLGDREATVTFHLPHGHDELLADIESTREFLARYTSLKGKSAKQKAKEAWRRKMHKRIAS